MGLPGRMVPVRKPSWLAAHTARSASALEKPSVARLVAAHSATGKSEIKHTVGEEEVVRAKGSVKVLFVGDLEIVRRGALPRPDPEVRGDNADGGGGGGDEDIGAGCLSS